MSPLFEQAYGQMLISFLHTQHPSTVRRTPERTRQVAHGLMMNAEVRKTFDVGDQNQYRPPHKCHSSRSKSMKELKQGSVKRLSVSIRRGAKYKLFLKLEADDGALCDVQVEIPNDPKSAYVRLET